MQSSVDAARAVAARSDQIEPRARPVARSSSSELSRLWKRELCDDGRHDSRRSGRRTVDAAVVDRWCAEFHATRDPELRDAIVNSHHWLAVVCARRMLRREEAFDDLVQIANIGLLKAVDRFDPSFAVSFHTFASATIIGELRRHYRTVWRVRVPRSLQERYVAVNGAIDELTMKLGRTPKPQDVSDHLHLELDDVLEAMSIGSALWVGSLTARSDDTTYEPPDVLATVDPALESAADRVELRALIARLPENQRTALYLTLFHEMRQSEVGQRLGLSQVQVSRLVRRAITALQEMMNGPRSAAPA